MRLLLALLALLLISCEMVSKPAPIVLPPTKAEAAAALALAKSQAQVEGMTNALGKRATDLAEQDARIAEAQDQLIAAEAAADAARRVLKQEREERTTLDRQLRDARTATVLEWAAGLFALAALLAGAAWWFMPLGKSTFAGIAIICGALSPLSLAMASYVSLLPWLGLAIALGAIGALWACWHSHAHALVDFISHPGSAQLASGLKERTRKLAARVKARL